MADPYFSDSGIDFLKEAEGAVKEGDLHVTYIDSVGVKTIGYGHTGAEVSMGQKISAATRSSPAATKAAETGPASPA